tara:strand:+ start:847 stop:1161 length:315 start_codon:yes stop_codon:yes gene_type:complete
MKYKGTTMDNIDTITINGETTLDLGDMLSYDAVNKPAHYNLGGGVECIDYIKQVLTLDGFISYCQGNMIKYQHRHGYKGNPVQDMEKAQWYLNKMLEAMKEKHR